MPKSFLIGVSLAALAAACATPVLAEEQPAGKDDRPQLEEVVVTAQKREERLQDVPIAVTAVSGDSLTKQGLNNPTDLVYVVPGLNFQPSANVRGEGFSIRGVGTAVFADSVEQSAGTVVDGVPYARTGQAVADLVDIDRVEVLRGPQGFLFGKNASAGVISITTKRPGSEPSFQARASYATHNEIKLSATGNLPVGDDLAFRLAVASTKADGIIENIVRHEDVNNRNSKAVVGKALWKPNDVSSVYISADYGRTDTRCCTWTQRSAPAGTQLGTLNAAAGIVPGPQNYRMAADQPFYQKSRTWGVSAEVNYDFGWANLTSITSYRNWKTSDNNDPDLLPFNYLAVNSGRSDLIQKSQELRLTSPADQRLAWIAGLYFDRIENEGHTNQSGGLNLGLPPSLLIGALFDAQTNNGSKAAFGQLSYSVTDQLKVIVGARYTHDEMTLDIHRYQAPGTIAGFGFLGTLTGKVTENNLSGRVTVQYDFTPDIMVYGMAGRGYKGPGLNTLSTTGTTTDIIRPEIPTAFEAGLRSRILGGTTFLNVSAFSTRYEDFQAQVFDQTITPATFRVTNAGELKTQGVEVEVLSRPARDTLLSFSAAYIDAKYTDFKNISCYLGQPILPLGTPRTSPRECITVSGTQAVTYGDGLPLTNQPKFTYNLGIQQDWHVGGMKLQGRLNWVWRDKVWFSPNGDPNTVQGSYGLLGGSLSLEPGEGAWRVSVYGRNLLDQHFAAYIFPSPVMGATGVYEQYLTPDAERSVGVAVELKF